MVDKGAREPSGELLARWQQGDQEAAGKLWRRYAERLIALARARLSKKLARHVDPEDLVQSAYRSFFVGARQARYVLQHSGDLWRLLVAITLHKLQHQHRRHSARKRAMNRESDPVDERRFTLQDQLLTREPSPEDAAALTDELEEIMRHLEPMQRQIIEMCLQGLDLKEIAAALGRHEGTVRRNLRQVKEFLKQRCAKWAAE
jgi:RNA polymerase sigma factor (sigma-70 family)